MIQRKLFVVCVDALSAEDYEALLALPNFSKLLKNGAVVRSSYPVFPSFTYPNHTAIMTGCRVGRHGVYHNENVVATEPNQPWFNQYSMIKEQSLIDVALEAGRSTFAISWPITGGAPGDVLPMIVPYGYTGWNPEPFLEGNATDELLEEYMWRYGYHLMGNNRSLDAFTMAVAPDYIRDHGQPDLMFVKLCDLDSARHRYGLHSAYAEEELRRHDQQLSVLLEALRRWGDLDNTVIAITGDHGTQDVTGKIHLNVLLREAGFISLGDDGRIVDWVAYSHGVGQSAWIEVNKYHADRYVDIYEFLKTLVADEVHGMKFLYTQDEAREEFGLYDGPFHFVICGDNGATYSSEWDGQASFVDVRDFTPGDNRGNHGGLPYTVPSLSIFYGPGIEQGAQLEHASLVDIAPTLAQLGGLEFKTPRDGRVLTELLDNGN